MKKLSALLLTILTAAAMLAQTNTPSTQPKLSPAEQAMAQANHMIDKNPKN